eukprot:m.12207 g.12207  ORF g.12207 m.12207 type:complete len:1107 (-) comp3966_c0_seq1:1200-4520(-)
MSDEHGSNVVDGPQNDGEFGVVRSDTATSFDLDRTGSSVVWKGNMKDPSLRTIQENDVIDDADVGDTLSERLILATRECNEKKISAILRVEGAKEIINGVDEEGLSALHYAARNSSGSAIVKLLLENGADPLVTGDEGVLPLHLAAKACNFLVMVEILNKLTNKRHLEIQDQYGSTALHYVVMKKNEHKCVDLLLSKGAKPSATDEQLLTPLHVACSYGHFKGVGVLLKYSKNAQSAMLAKDIDGATPMHAAMGGGDSRVLRRLLSASTNVEGLLNAQDEQLNTPLHTACEHQAQRMAQILLQNGANTEAQNIEGQTPLHVAARGTNVKLVSKLLEKSAKINALDHALMTPLHRAALFDRKDIIKALLQKDAPLDAMDNDGFTPLLCACWKGQTDAARLLIDSGASLAHTDNTGRNALLWAVREQNEKVVNLIISMCQSNPAPIQETDRYTDSALHIAVETGNKNIVRALLRTSERRFLLSRVNDEEKTPLHVAAMNGNVSIAMLLLKDNHRLMDVGDFENNTALHIAATKGHRNFVRALLDKGATIDSRNDRRWTPLDCAAHGGHNTVVDELLERDAPVDTVDNNQMTPLHLACERGHVAVIDLLLKYHASLKALNADNHNALDIAVLNGQVNAAQRIIKNSRWEEAMAHVTDDGMSPFKRMILYLPDAALHVLDRCRVHNGMDPNSPLYKVTMLWKYIDEKYDNTFKSNVEQTPLWLMQKHNRGNLLAHPVVEALLFYKNKRFGALVYYVNALLYGFFLYFFTQFVVTVPVTIGAVPDLSSVNFVGQVVSIVFPILRIVLEILQMIFDGRKYFYDPVNLLEWGLFSSSTAFFVPIFLGSEFTVAQWSSGAVAIFLAWVNVVVIMRKVDMFGIYVLMFEETLATVGKVLLVFTLFIVGFALSFHIMFFESYFFHKPSRSLMKTFIMMTGEFEYIDYFPSTLEYPTIPYFMFSIFVFVMPIILMNLLVGLAVGDIQRILDNARLTRRKLRVQDLLPLEAFLVWVRSMLPFKVANHFYRAKYSLVVHKSSIWRFVSKLIFGQGDQSILDGESVEDVSELEQLRRLNKRLTSDVKVLNQKLTTLSSTVEDQIQLIRDLCELKGIEFEE